MDALPVNELLQWLSPDEVDKCTDEELADLDKQVALTPHSSFPTHQRIHERAQYLRQVIAQKAALRQEKKEWDKWSAEMFQRIEAHDTAMAVAKAQLDHQKSSSNRAMWISIAAALAAIASAILAWLALLRMPPNP
jgi:hypothetical protein